MEGCISEEHGVLGGNSKLRIYGQLDCWSTLSAIKRYPGSYEKSQVLFADEKMVLAAGYRRCGNCMRKRSQEYKPDTDAYRAKLGL